MTQKIEGSIAVLTGGIGGAKLVLGLSKIVPPERINAIVNIGDDFSHLGLHISPDIDTLIYTLTDLADPERGWGRRGETWNFMSALGEIGGEDWFSLGDRDLALHIERSQRLREGESLSAITKHFAKQLGTNVHILPVSDDLVSTELMTNEGRLSFQDYFVRKQCQPEVSAISFVGEDSAKPSPGTLEVLEADDLEAIIIAPSNPWLSIDPILAVPRVSEAMKAASAPVIAVTPLPGGEAVKGPTAKIMSELGLKVSLSAILDHYEGVIDGILIDERDHQAPSNLPFAVCNTIMRSLDDRVSVAKHALSLARELAG